MLTRYEQRKQNDIYKHKCEFTDIIELFLYNHVHLFMLVEDELRKVGNHSHQQYNSKYIVAHHQRSTK